MFPDFHVGEKFNEIISKGNGVQLIFKIHASLFNH
jgi:hypothetical protein